MFSSSMVQPAQLIQTFLPGIQSTNNLVIGARSGARHASKGLLCEHSLRETLRKLECLSSAELSVLSSKCADIIPTILPPPQNLEFDQNPRMVDCFGSAKTLLKTEKKIQIYLKRWEGADNRYLLPKSKLFRNQAASPFLQSARGFKTRRSSDESGAPFTRSKKASSEEADQDAKSQAELLGQILKHIDLPKQEREKVNIAQAKLNSLLGTLKNTTTQRLESPDKEINLAKPTPKRPPKRNKKTGKPTKEIHKNLDAEVVDATKQVANIIKDPVKRDLTESVLLKKLKSVQAEAKAAKHDDTVAGEADTTATIANLFQDLNVEKPKKVVQDDSHVQYGGLVKDDAIDKQRKKEMTLDQVAFLEKRNKMRREAARKRMTDEKPIDIFGAEPLGVFLEPVVADEGKVGELKMWRACVERELRILSTPSPRNALEEMIVWTEQGKLWQFPILNERGIDCEDDPFHKHVFLEHNLEPWCPPSGPVRHFMELVCVGLSKNPYMSSQKKVETIIWFKDYFERPESIEILNDAGAWELESSN